MPTTNIHESEWEDFNTELKRHGRSSDEFETEEYVQPLKGTALQPLVGTITIRSKATRTERQYQTGFGSNWPARFSDDLSAKVF